MGMGWGGIGRGGTRASYLGGRSNDGEQDGQQHQPIEQPQQRQDGEHRKEVPGGTASRGCKQARPP